VTSQVINDKLAINKADFEDSAFVLVKTDQLAEAIFVAKDEDDNYVALLTRCTHKGCEIRPAANILACPCHGSEFDFNGQVLTGPAEEDLRKFQVETDETKVYIF